ncbi:MAG: complex I subunit 1 family protein [Elusimicrobiota bacterium]
MILLEYILFPGLIFTLILAFTVSWIDRKVSALIQWRVGPPLLQSVYDFLKLMKKETVIPANANRFIFLLAPVISFSSLILVSMILVKGVLSQSGFVGDVIAIIYLLMIPSFAIIMGGAASANPLASIGASREMKMAISYELPLILAVCVVFIKIGGAVGIGEILEHQAGNGIVAGSLSGCIAFIVTLLCLQSKMGQVPFDLPEAEQEIMGGAIIEYTGPPLGLFVVSRWILMGLLPLFMVILFLGGIGSPAGILKYVGVLVLVILIKNTNPRLRINQTLRFFWGPVTMVSFLAVLLAYIGL